MYCEVCSVCDVICDVYGGWWCGNINYGLLTIDYDGKPGPAEAGH